MTVTELWDHARNPPFELMGEAATKLKCLRMLGLHVLHVPWPLWRTMPSFDDKKKWMAARLLEIGCERFVSSSVVQH